MNFYEELQRKITFHEDKIHNALSQSSAELHEIEKYMDDNFPKYKEDWDKNKWDIEWYWKHQLDKNKEKFNI